MENLVTKLKATSGELCGPGTILLPENTDKHLGEVLTALRRGGSIKVQDIGDLLNYIADNCQLKEETNGN